MLFFVRLAVGYFLTFFYFYLMNTDLLLRGQPRSVTAAVLAGRPWAGPSILNSILRSHSRVLARMMLHDKGVARAMLPALTQLIPLVEARTPLLTSVKRHTLNTIPVLVRLASHESDWIRSPKEWEPDLQMDPESLLNSLIDHLLVRYPLPRFAYHAWHIVGPLHHVERDWFCHLALGNNLRTFRGWLPQVSRKAVHLFQTAPADFSMKEAVRFGQVQAIWNDAEIAERIVKSRIGLDFENDDIWLPLFEMWAASGLSVDLLLPVADYLWADAHTDGLESIRLKGRSCDSLLGSALRYFCEIRKAMGRSCDNKDRFPDWFLDFEERGLLLRRHADHWKPFEAVSFFEADRFGWHWEISELTNPRALFQEGRDMGHCVGLYSGDCQRGESSIFSLRSRKLSDPEMDREVTIEVDRESRRLRQVRAYQNRRPQSATQRVILEWCERNSLAPGAWSRW